MGLGAGDKGVRRGLAARPLLVAVLGLGALTLLPYCLLLLLSPAWRAMEAPMPEPGRVLLVTAHPDDETVFFSPAITALHAAGSEVFLLCLTTGNAHGKGKLRVKELQQAAAALQIDGAHLSVKDEEDKLPDSKSLAWDQPYAQSQIQAAVTAWRIQTILTFDRGGVTGHKNHQSCWQAVREFVSNCAGGVCPDAWALVSVGRWRQYSLMFDDPHHGGHHRAAGACYVTRSLWQTFHAMWHHHTQWRWWSHVLFTRYTYVNKLRQIVPVRPAVALT